MTQLSSSLIIFQTLHQLSQRRIRLNVNLSNEEWL